MGGKETWGGGREKMVVMSPQGMWAPYGEELVLKEDGLLHHAQIKEQWY